MRINLFPVFKREDPNQVVTMSPKRVHLEGLRLKDQTRIKIGVVDFQDGGVKIFLLFSHPRTLDLRIDSIGPFNYLDCGFSDQITVRVSDLFSGFSKGRPIDPITNLGLVIVNILNRSAQIFLRYVEIPEDPLHNGETQMIAIELKLGKIDLYAVEPLSRFKYLLKQS